MGTVVAIVHHLLTAIALLLVVALALPGLAGDTHMVLATLFVVLPWLAFAVIWCVLIHQRRATSGIGTGDWLPPAMRIAQMAAAFATILFAVLAFASCGPPYIFSLFHFGGIALFVVGYLGWWLLPLATGNTRPSNLALGLIGGPFAFLIGFFWVFISLFLEGSIDPDDYEKAQYYLPYANGESARVVQGNDSGMNHNGHQKFAWDFWMSCGTEVVAARDGEVKGAPVDSHDENGHGKPNNKVLIEHTDGTVAHYLHIQKDSVSVVDGQAIKRGQVIARVGNVGNSITGHLHFHVLNAAEDPVGVRFVDVKGDDGIPRLFGRYTSANK